jgi:hypothetical protein
MLACAAIATVPFGSFSAEAHSKTFKSQITIQYNAGSRKFSGRVTSASKLCRAGRSVTVFAEVSGHSEKPVGHDTTDGDGTWGPVSSPGPGFYFAQVKQAPAGGYGIQSICSAAESRTIHVRPRHPHGDAVDASQP